MGDKEWISEAIPHRWANRFMGKQVRIKCDIEHGWQQDDPSYLYEEELIRGKVEQLLVHDRYEWLHQKFVPALIIRLTSAEYYQRDSGLWQYWASYECPRKNRRYRLRWNEDELAQYEEFISKTETTLILPNPSDQEWEDPCWFDQAGNRIEDDDWPPARRYYSDSRGNQFDDDSIDASGSNSQTMYNWTVNFLEDRYRL